MFVDTRIARLHDSIVPALHHSTFMISDHEMDKLVRLQDAWECLKLFPAEGCERLRRCGCFGVTKNHLGAQRFILKPTGENAQCLKWT